MLNFLEPLHINKSCKNWENLKPTNDVSSCIIAKGNQSDQIPRPGFVFLYDPTPNPQRPIAKSVNKFQKDVQK